MIRVSTKKEAWRVADALFPGDYEKNSLLSDRAGYPVYQSTAIYSDSRISDLGDRLELNFDNGDSLNIWIDSDPVSKDITVCDIAALNKGGFLSIHIKHMGADFVACHSSERIVSDDEMEQLRRLNVTRMAETEDGLHLYT